MTHPLTPREKVAAAINEFVFQAHNGRLAGVGGEIDAILTALASGSGDHAELARLSRKAREQMTCEATTDALCDGVDALLEENAALRENEKTALKECSEWARKAGEAIGKLETSEAAGIVEGWQERATEAERKLAEAVGLLRDWMGTWFVDADSRGENAIADDTRKFLSKEAERG